MKKKKTPDLSNTGGRIGSYLNPEHLNALNPELGMSGNVLDNLANCINVEVHYLVRRLDLARFAREAKRNNRNLDYKNDIEIAAKELIKRISRAPMPIANDPNMYALVQRLNGIREEISEIQTDPILADFELNDVYRRSDKKIRIDFVVDARNIFRSCSKSAGLTRGDRKNGVLVFRLIKICYERAGINRSDKIISIDISAAKKSG